MNETTETPGTDQTSRGRGLAAFTEVRRPRHDRVLAGVCSGIGHRFGVDPVVIRVFAVVLVFAGLAGLILYGAAWLLLPADDEQRSHVAEWFGLEGSESQVREAGLLIAAVLAVVAVVGGGGWAWPGVDWFFWSVAWIVLPIAFVVWLVARGREDRRVAREAPLRGAVTPTDTAPTHTAPAAPIGADTIPATASADPPTGEAARPSDPIDGPASGDTLVDPLAADDGAAGPGRLSDQPPAPPAGDPPPSAAPEQRRPCRDPFTWTPTVVTLSIIAIVTATVHLAAEPDWSVLFAIALALTGAGLLLSAMVRGAAPLVLLGLALIPALAVSTVVPTFTAGDERIDVTSVGELEPEYSLGAGRFELDLTALDPDVLEGRTLTIDTGLGETFVRLPEGLETEADVSVRAGQIDVLGERADGLNRTVRTDQSGPALELVIDHSAGRVEVTR